MCKTSNQQYKSLKENVHCAMICHKIYYCVLQHSQKDIFVYYNHSGHLKQFNSSVLVLACKHFYKVIHVQRLSSY